MTLLLLFGPSGGVTQTVTLQSRPGLTGHSIVLKSPLGVELGSQSATELSDGVYGASFSDIAAGFAFVQFVKDSNGRVISFGNVTLTEDTDTFPVSVTSTMDANIVAINGTDVQLVGTVNSNVVSVNSDTAAADRLEDLLTTINTALEAYRTNGVASGNDLEVVDANVDQILAVTDDTYTYVQSLPSAIDNAAAIDAELTLQHGSGDWTDSGVSSESDLMVSTTIATLASQTSFTLTAGSVDNDAYNRQLVVITDAATSTQKARGIVSDYVGSTKTVTLASGPSFTIAAGDSISIIAVGSDVSSTQVLSAVSSAIVSAGITTTVTGMPTFLRVGDARTVANGGAIPVRLYDVDDDSLLFGLGTSLFADATITFSLRRAGTDSAEGVEDAAIPCTWVEDGADGYVQIAYEADALDDCDAMDRLKEKDCHRWGIKFQWGTDDPITPVYGTISVLRKIVTTQS